MPELSLPTAILVHGAGGGGWEWCVWQRVFAARGWPVLAPDLRPVADGLVSTRFDDYAAQVRAWCSASAQPHVLIGASLGGLLAMAVAAALPPSVLVLINPLAPPGIERRALRIDRGDIVPWGRGRSLASTRRAMPDADDAACLFAFRRWRDESGAVLRDAADITVAAPQCRTLVVASGCDEDCPAEASRSLAARFGGDFRLLPDASHVGPLLGRNAATVADDVWQWCAKHVRP